MADEVLDRESEVFMAKLTEQAERYEGRWNVHSYNRAVSVLKNWDTARSSFEKKRHVTQHDALNFFAPFTHKWNLRHSISPQLFIFQTREGVSKSPRVFVRNSVTAFRSLCTVRHKVGWLRLIASRHNCKLKLAGFESIKRPLFSCRFPLNS